jgi:hypothetical protein
MSGDGNIGLHEVECNLRHWLKVRSAFRPTAATVVEVFSQRHMVGVPATQVQSTSACFFAVFCHRCVAGPSAAPD